MVRLETLTLNVPCISESYIEIKIKLKFLFSHFFLVPQKVLWRPFMKALKFNLVFSLRPELGREGF